MPKLILWHNFFALVGADPGFLEISGRPNDFIFTGYLKTGGGGGGGSREPIETLWIRH